MKKYVYRDLQFVRVEEANPVCGEDFCDRCGDCLACYGDFECYGVLDGEEPLPDHFWVVYEDASDERKA